MDRFASLDDTDILAAIKQWQHNTDFVLSKLCGMILNRRLLNIRLKDKPEKENKFQEIFEDFKAKYKLSDSETAYFVFRGIIENKAYNQHSQNINILRSNGKLMDVAKASDHLNLTALSETVTKYYICFPKDDL